MPGDRKGQATGRSRGNAAHDDGGGKPTADGGAPTLEERRAAEAVDAERLFALLADLVTIESVANQETPAQERVAAEMRSIGLETDVWEIDFERLRHAGLDVHCRRVQPDWGCEWPPVWQTSYRVARPFPVRGRGRPSRKSARMRWTFRSS